MIQVILRVALVIALPIVVFLGGVSLMSRASGRGAVVLKPAEKPGDDTPLNQRPLGYDADAVRRFWSRFGDGLVAEQRFLVFDLVFPLVYGAAFAVSLLLAWWTLGRPFSPVWIIAPIGITIVADWTENLTQLAQLRRYLAGQALQDGWIALASAATSVKLVFFTATAIGVLVLVVAMVVRPLRS